LISSRVVDTDVLSFLFKKDSRAEVYRSHLGGRLTVISFMTLAETYRWSLARNWGARRRSRLDEFLSNFAVVYSDRALCLKWAEAMDSARRNGRPILTADAWIAATALLHAVPLVTHNYASYAGVDGLTIVSESRPS
jgi:predicted nucleic acid-binding protein